MIPSFYQSDLSGVGHLASLLARPRWLPDRAGGMAAPAGTIGHCKRAGERGQESRRKKNALNVLKYTMVHTAVTATGGAQIKNGSQ